MLTEDLSTLTTIPKQSLDNLIKKAEICIVDQALEQVYQDKTILELDIGIGKLLLKLYDSEIKYKFIPSDKFNSMLSTTIFTKENTLAKTLEKNLVSKITKTYKDLL